MTREQTAPADIVLMRLSSVLEAQRDPGGHSFTFDKGEIVSCLKQAGFDRVDSRMLDLPTGESEMVVARKMLI